MTLGQLGMALPLGLLRGEAERGPVQILLVTAAGALGVFAALAALGPRWLGLDVRRLFPRPSRRDLVFAAQAAIPLWLLSILVNLLNIAAFGPSPQALVVTFSGHEGAAAIAIDIAAGAVVAPLAEETLYRGILFAGLAQRLPFIAAAGISGAMFAVVHGLGVALPIFVLAVGLAWVYARTRTLWGPILTHGLVNAISLGLLFGSRAISP
jgi:membrane protease YdiL (CAAX protease family)